MVERHACFTTSESFSQRYSHNRKADYVANFSVITLIGTMFIVLSLSEIASIYPTAGGTINLLSFTYPNDDPMLTKVDYIQ